jgi:hypothetical protein
MVEEHRTGMKTACRADQHGWLASWQLRAALTEKTPLSSQSASGGDQNDRTASWQLRATLTEKTRALSTQSCRRSRLQTITSMDQGPAPARRQRAVLTRMVGRRRGDCMWRCRRRRCSRYQQQHEVLRGRRLVGVVPGFAREGLRLP